MNINIFVHSDHARNQVTRRSYTGIIIFINIALIIFTQRSNQQLRHQHTALNLLH